MYTYIGYTGTLNALKKAQPICFKDLSVQPSSMKLAYYFHVKTTGQQLLKIIRLNHVAIELNFKFTNLELKDQGWAVQDMTFPNLALTLSLTGLN
jgi:hypothetical protein